MKKILFLCDAHEFIRHEGNNLLMLKQLYVTVFLLKKQDVTLHISNRSSFGFEVFWKPESRFYNYLDDYMIREADTKDYDVVICLPEYKSKLQNVYALLELQYKCETHHPNVGKLFTKGGLFEITRDSKSDAEIAAFKNELDNAQYRFSITRQEERIEHHNQPLNINTERVLVLDDYNRPFFIGDSVYWLAKIRKLTDVFPETTSICINVANTVAFRTISEVFTPSLPGHISFSNDSWDNISLTSYDLVLCNNDVLLKFFWYFKDIQTVYSFSVMDERPIGKTPTLDFYTTLFYNGYQLTDELPAFKQLSLLPQEHDWADDWFREKGVSADERVFVLIHAASTPDKVIADDEMLKLLDHLSQYRVLLVSYGLKKENPALCNALSAYENVLIEDSLNLRQTMSLLGNKSIVAIVGPCTGLMHLADSICTDVPLLLTYTGKQGPERVYHPKNWWSNSRHVKCYIAVADDRKLIPLAQCPPDYDSFNRVSISADNISSNTLLKQLKIHLLEPTLS